MLASHLRIAALLAELDDAPYRRDAIEQELAAEITALWQTDEVRSHRPRVVDEIRNGHWFFEQSLIDAAEQLLADYRRHLPDAPTPLRFGTWIGGDADGNPNAGADTMREALERARTLLRHRYRDEVRELAAAIGVSSLLTPVDPELLASIERDELEMPAYASAIGDQNIDEPYRRKLSFMWRRLDADAYESVDDFAADLELLDRSLRAHRGARIADGALAALRRRVEIFGLHLAKLDVRVHAREADERIRDLLDGAAAARARHGPQALDTVIVSGTSSAQDVRRVRELSAEPLSFVPLFESVEDLRAAPRDLRGAARHGRLPRGDGRLLRLGEGRGLPRGAVGDPQRARRARRGRAPARRAADGLPRARRQRRPRRRPDVRGDPRAAAGRAAGAAEDHRAGRDDRVQVRPARARAGEPRIGARRDAPRRVPRGGRRRHLARRASSPIARAPCIARSSTIPASSTSSARSRRSTSSRC